MKLMIKPGLFSWNGTMPAWELDGRVRYYITGDGFHIGKRIHVRDLAGREAVYIRQLIPSMLPCYEMENYGRPIGILHRQREGGYFLDRMNWMLYRHENGCEIQTEGQTVASASEGAEPGKLLLNCGEAGLAALGGLLLLTCVR